MTRLALRSLRARKAAFGTTALTVLLGTSLMLAFLSLLDTAGGPGISDADHDSLVTMASVVGAWGVLIVGFSVASTLALAVRARSEEFALLRTVGATPRQVRRMVARETSVVVLLSALVGLVPGVVFGRVLVGLISGSVVADGVEPRVGPLSLGITFAAVLVAAFAGTWFTARRATRGPVTTSLLESRVEREGTGRRRIAIGVVLLAVGATYSTLTVTVMAHQSDPWAAMQTGGPACIFWGAGLAVLAAPLLRLVALVLSPVLRGGPSSYLAVQHVRRRTRRVAGIAAPVIFGVSGAAGTLTLMAIQSGTNLADAPENDTIGLLNYVVSGAISVFVLIVVVNTLVAAVADRRREFAVQRLAGFSPEQLSRTVALEALLVVVTGVVFGGLASLGTSIPYAVVKTDGWFPASGVWLLALVAAFAAVFTLGTAVTVARRASRVPAVAAVAA